MQRSKLKQQASEYYHHSPLSCWILGLTSGALIAAVLAFDLLVPFVSFVTIPLLAIPIYFSAIIQHVMLKSENQITMSTSLRSFALYFRRDFFGTFSIIFNFLKSLIVFLICETVISMVASMFYALLNPSFQASVESLYNLLYSMEYGYQDIINLMNANNYLLLNYVVICFVPSYFVSLIFFIYNVSRYSMMIYYKMHLRRSDARFSRLVYQFALRGKRMEVFRAYTSLNWPLYLLLILGSIGGSIFGYFFFHDLMKIVAFGLVGMAALAMFFLPFYFSNQQALYDMYAPTFVDATKAVTASLIGNLQANMELSKEEEERLKETLSDLDGPLNDSEGEDNKKDPEGS